MTKLVDLGRVGLGRVLPNDERQKLGLSEFGTCDECNEGAEETVAHFLIKCQGRLPLHANLTESFKRK